MRHPLARIACLALALAVAAAASAQPEPVLRGTVSAVKGGALHLRSASGQDTTVTLPDDVRVSVRVPAKLEDIALKTYVGVAATPGPNDTLVASVVQIFPDAMRGTGEGHHPMAAMPGSTMTNATVSRISGRTMTSARVSNVGSGANGRTLQLRYKGGKQTVFVSSTTPVVRYERGSPAALTPGAQVIVYAKRDSNGNAIAERISVGANGSVPPI